MRSRRDLDQTVFGNGTGFVSHSVFTPHDKAWLGALVDAAEAGLCFALGIGPPRIGSSERSGSIPVTSIQRRRAGEHGNSFISNTQLL